jgi:XTP/dITP diphosphohydrolase
MKLIFASANENKVREIQALLNKQIEVKGLSEIGFTDDIPETADDLQGNALLKARYVFNKVGADVFADDTGLEIEALKGRPGVYSARYAGEEKNPRLNVEKVLTEMQGIVNRRARFRTVIALILHGKEYFFEGIVEGTILASQQGEGGFGYDPIFLPSGSDRSFAEMNLDEKNQTSHRARAIRKLIQFLELEAREAFRS